MHLSLFTPSKPSLFPTHSLSIQPSLFQPFSLSLSPFLPLISTSITLCIISMLSVYRFVFMPPPPLSLSFYLSCFFSSLSLSPSLFYLLSLSVYPILSLIAMIKSFSILPSNGYLLLFHRKFPFCWGIFNLQKAPGRRRLT